LEKVYKKRYLEWSKYLLFFTHLHFYNQFLRTDCPQQLFLRCCLLS
jgi:hypothetical protein